MHLLRISRTFLCIAGISASLLFPVFPARLLAQPQTAEQLAEAVDAHYNALRSLRVAFMESYDGMGLHRVERGTLLLSKSGRLHEGRMRWTYADPPGKLFVFDGRDAYFYAPGQDEVQRVPAKQLGADDDPRSPMALLLGHARLAKQLAGLTVTPAADGDAMLPGVPRGLEGRVSRLGITAAPDGTVHGLTIEELDGSRTRFTFSAEQPNPPAPTAAFVFTAPAGTHIVNGLPPI